MAPSDKLRDPPIVEALLEVRFQTNELREVVTGRLSDIEVWRGAQKVRLPAADIPDGLRTANPELLFLPTVEIRGISSGGSPARARVGGNVLSLHFMYPYEGWDSLFPQIREAVGAMFRVLPGLVVQRLGLRYINGFTSQRHAVSRITDLAVHVAIAKHALQEEMQLTFIERPLESHQLQVRILTGQFMRGASVSPDTSVIADIDVATPSPFTAQEAKTVNDWTDTAHTMEKQAFRRLVPDDLYLSLLAERPRATS